MTLISRGANSNISNDCLNSVLITFTILPTYIFPTCVLYNVECDDFKPRLIHALHLWNHEFNVAPEQLEPPDCSNDDRGEGIDSDCASDKESDSSGTTGYVTVIFGPL